LEIEADIRGKSAADRRVRQASSKRLARRPPDPQITGPHALNHWAGLAQFRVDGRIERAMPPVAARAAPHTASLSIWKHWSLIAGMCTNPTVRPYHHAFPDHCAGSDLAAWADISTGFDYCLRKSPPWHRRERR
jgi:hypothetical protein